MKLYRSHSSSPPRYFHRERHIIHFAEEALRIDTFDAKYLKLDPELRQVHTPSIRLKHLGSAFWAEVVAFNRLPISLTVEGRDTGTIDENWGYSAAADGHYQRCIHFAQARATFEDTNFHLELKLCASAVLQKDPPLQLSDHDRLPQELLLAFDIPLELMPEMLKMNETLRLCFNDVIQGLQNDGC